MNKGQCVSNLGELIVVLATIQLINTDIQLLKEDGRRMKSEIMRLNDSFKWFVGITITIYIGLFGVIVTLLASLVI